MAFGEALTHGIDAANVQGRLSRDAAQLRGLRASDGHALRGPARNHSAAATPTIRLQPLRGRNQIVASLPFATTPMPSPATATRSATVPPRRRPRRTALLPPTDRHSTPTALPRRRHDHERPRPAPARWRDVGGAAHVHGGCQALLTGIQRATVDSVAPCPSLYCRPICITARITTRSSRS